MAKGVPKRDGSGQGTRKNQGRGGCSTVKKAGQGRRASSASRGQSVGRK